MMGANTELKPSFSKRDGVRLAYLEAGPAHGRTPPLILVNGWTGDHRIFTPQIDHFAKSRRVVAIDLRARRKRRAEAGIHHGGICG
jgi:pimeloyl-ACP methyl ester carboxylesterase